ncbi:hypothetical protein [Fusobacterium massiliense]|uniref:hypothetical protein n=1 Tax=Fusobacterium massiliense TaxID=1852365 RepID=UPI0028EF451D|nr:hypothetical protein [Fusobacterium massiliense]
MKKILAIFLFLLISILSLANVNDNLNLLKDDDKKEINEKIKQIKKEKDVTVFVNTLYMEESFVVSDPERALILNLKKSNDEKYNVEVSFSKDIDVDDYQEEMNNLLNETATLLERKEYTKYILTILDGATAILQEVNIDPLNQMTMTKEQKDGKDVSIWPILLIMVLVGIGYKGYTVYEEKRANKRDSNEKND